VTLVTVLSIVAVVSVYAVLIGTFTGDQVTVGGMGSGNLMYNTVNAEGTWLSTVGPGVGGAWYARTEIATGGYSGPVTIAWHLENKTASSTWEDVTGATVSTSVVLTGLAQNVYASTDGGLTSNHNWGLNSQVAGAYRVVAEVNSA